MQGGETDGDESTNDRLSMYYEDLRQAGKVNVILYRTVVRS